MRSHTRSRYYLQVPLTDKVERWSDEAFWAELRLRLDDAGARRWSPGRRSRRASRRCAASWPSRCASAACSWPATPGHIVPPTGAKGLNLAATDVKYLASALVEHYRDRSDAGLDGYSARCLRRVWRAERFSWWFTSLMHRFPDDGAIGAKLQDAELDYLFHSEHAARTVAENYVGLPLDFGDEPAPPHWRPGATRDHRRARPLHDGAQGAGGVAQPPDRRHHGPGGQAPASPSWSSPTTRSARRSRPTSSSR